MTNLMQARIDTYADTVEYGERGLITVEDGKIIVYTLNANDSAVPLLNKTKIIEKVY